MCLLPSLLAIAIAKAVLLVKLFSFLIMWSFISVISWMYVFWCGFLLNMVEFVSHTVLWVILFLWLPLWVVDVIS